MAKNLTREKKTRDQPSSFALARFRVPHVFGLLTYSLERKEHSMAVQQTLFYSNNFNVVFAKQQPPTTPNALLTQQPPHFWHPAQHNYMIVDGLAQWVAMLLHFSSSTLSQHIRPTLNSTSPLTRQYPISKTLSCFLHFPLHTPPCLPPSFLLLMLSSAFPTIHEDALPPHTSTHAHTHTHTHTHPSILPSYFWLFYNLLSSLKKNPKHNDPPYHQKKKPHAPPLTLHNAIAPITLFLVMGRPSFFHSTHTHAKTPDFLLSSPLPSLFKKEEKWTNEIKHKDPSALCAIT